MHREEQNELRSEGQRALADDGHYRHADAPQPHDDGKGHSVIAREGRLRGALPSSPELSGEGRSLDAVEATKRLPSAGQAELQGEGRRRDARKGRRPSASALQPNGGDGAADAAPKGPSRSAPSSPPQRSEEGHRISADEGRDRGADLASTLDQLAEYTVDFLTMIRARNRLILPAKAVVRRALGWYSDDEDSKREALNARAARIVDVVVYGEKPKPEDAEIIELLRPKLTVWKEMISVAELQINALEKAMCALVPSLPGYEFQQSVKGFGDKAFALIVGLAGDLSKYPKKGHLHRRLAIAPFEKDGVVKAPSTWRMKGGLTTEDWADRERGPKYSPERRSVLFAYLEDPLIKLNGDGYYRSVYLRTKEREGEKAAAAGLIVAPSAKIPRKRQAEFMSVGQIERRARRAMSQKLLRDLWAAWRRASEAVTGDRSMRPVLAADESPIAREARRTMPAKAIEQLPTGQPQERKAILSLPAKAANMVPSARLPSGP